MKNYLTLSTFGTSTAEVTAVPTIREKRVDFISVGKFDLELVSCRLLTVILVILVNKKQV